MKQSGHCPKCQSARVGVIIGVYDDWTTRIGPELAEYGIPTGTAARTGSDLERTAFVCAECGYYETYLSRPAEVDWDNLQGTFRWLNPTAGPFR